MQGSPVDSCSPARGGGDGAVAQSLGSSQRGPGSNPSVEWPQARCLSSLSPSLTSQGQCWPHLTGWRQRGRSETNDAGTQGTVSANFCG